MLLHYTHNSAHYGRTTHCTEQHCFVNCVDNTHCKYWLLVKILLVAGRRWHLGVTKIVCLYVTGNLVQIHFAIWDKYILQFETNTSTRWTTALSQTASSSCSRPTPSLARSWPSLPWKTCFLDKSLPSTMGIIDLIWTFTNLYYVWNVSAITVFDVKTVRYNFTAEPDQPLWFVEQWNAFYSNSKSSCHQELWYGQI